MAYLVIEINLHGLSRADIDDRCGFKGDEQDDINGAINWLAGCASGAYSCDTVFSSRDTALLAGTTIPVPPPASSLMSDLLGAFSNFVGLAHSTLTNTGSSVITGDIGVSPGTSITGFPPGTVTGTIRLNDGPAAAGEVAVLNAYNNLAGRAVTQDLSGQDLGSRTLTAGVYNFSSSAQLTGALTLSGSATDQFIFKIGSTLTTATSSSVVLTGGVISDNIAWQVGSSATLGTSTAFAGNIFASASCTANTGASVNGRLLAVNAAVTLDDNAIAVIS